MVAVDAAVFPVRIAGEWLSLANRFEQPGVLGMTLRRPKEIL